MKFRKKPIVIDAVQYMGANYKEIIEFGKQSKRAIYINRLGELIISTLEGEMKANIGDWIIKGVNQEMYPCKPNVFEKTYEAVKE
jgi:hypothetical protein